MTDSAAPEATPGSEGTPAPEACAAEASAPAATAPEAHSREALLDLALSELRQRRAGLEAEISALEKRRQQIEQDINGSFSGRADSIARRLKGFQDYLVGALQDLAASAEQMELVAPPIQLQPSPLDRPAEQAAAGATAVAPAAAGQFSQDEELIRRLLESYQGQPDFYAEPWKLRRSLERPAAEQLADWFLGQGGRGAQASGGSRSRNVLMGGAAIAILGELYGDRFQTLVLAGEPERLGEWRRGLQDCLGLNREDFGPASGVVLFERADALIERADRLEERGELPFILIDAAERAIEIPILQFPLWLAFAAAPEELAREEDLL